MSDSLFAVLRIVAMMLVVDRKINLKERAWFLDVVSNFQTTFQQRSILRSHLLGKSEEDLESILGRIEPDDKGQLLNFLKVAMNVDDSVVPSEAAFYRQVKEIAESAPIAIDYSEYGRLLLERDKEMHFWNMMGEAGKLLNARRGQFESNYFSIDRYWFQVIEIFFYERKSIFVSSFLLLVAIMFFFWRR